MVLLKSFLNTCALVAAASDNYQPNTLSISEPTALLTAADGGTSGLPYLQR
jgi:hypothetical protein